MYPWFSFIIVPPFGKQKAANEAARYPVCHFDLMVSGFGTLWVTQVAEWSSGQIPHTALHDLCLSNHSIISCENARPIPAALMYKKISEMVTAEVHKM
jgi:hypothetical protein